MASDAENFDPATGTFRATDGLQRPRLMPATVAVGDRVLLLGQFDQSWEDTVTNTTTEWLQ